MKSSIKKFVQGIGINDAGYQVTTRNEDGKNKVCPYYRTWASMLARCQSAKCHILQPTYKGCSVCDEWLHFSNFKRWMEQQDWEGKQLDKDLLVGGNKVYSPLTCIFLPSCINKSLTLRGSRRGAYPVGVSYVKRDRVYKACCNNGAGKAEYLGSFTVSKEAHRAWQVAKISVLNRIKDSEQNNFIKEGLQRVIDKIQFDYDNNLETIDLN